MKFGLHISRFDDISAANQELVEKMLSSGDAANPQFRGLCYAAASDILNRYILDKTPVMSAEQREQLRKSLAAIVDEIESRHAGAETTSSRVDLTTSLASPTWSLVGSEQRSPPDGPAVVLSADKDNGKTTTWWKGLFTGISVAFLATFLLHISGVIYVHGRPEAFRQFRSFNEAVESATPMVERSLAALERTQSQLRTALEKGTLANNQTIRQKFLPLPQVFPELAAELLGAFPPPETIIIRLSETPEPGYKILMQSEFCPVVKMLAPEKIDPRRSSNTLFCRYFGVWTENAQQL